MRRFARKDKNHKAIVEGLRDLGCSVLDLSQLGHGVPDILVGYKDVNYLIEIKSINEMQQLSSGAMRSLVTQRAWLTMWRGRPVQIVTSLAGALTALGIAVAAKPKA